MTFQIVIPQSTSSLRRPIELVDGHPWSSTWVPVTDTEGNLKFAQLTFDANFEQLFSDVSIDGHKALSEAPMQIHRHKVPVKPDTLLSSAAYSDYVLRKKPLPSPKIVFGRVQEAFDHFVAFNEVYGSQDAMAAFLACWTWSTYAQNIFSVAGYIWTTGEAGSGKSQCLKTMSELAFMGHMVVSGSSPASTRDLADIGSTMLFDDCESIRSPELREILLSGNSKGASSIKQTPDKRDGEWKPQAFSLYGPRAFSAIALPDPTLGSRSIMIPFQRSNDKARTQRDPMTAADWVKPACQIRDAIWLNTVKHLAVIDRYRKELNDKIHTTGRDADIWVPSLTIALWLEREWACDGLFDKVLSVFEDYQKYKVENSIPSELVVLLEALSNGLNIKRQRHSRMPTSEIQRLFQEAARNRDISDTAYLEISASRVGSLMGRSGFKASKSHRAGRSWMVSEQEVQQLAKLHGVELELPKADEDERDTQSEDQTIWLVDNKSNEDELAW